jgi:Rod binding domain-containing protein
MPGEAEAGRPQTQIFVRLTIGAMREALKLVEKLFVQSQFGREFVPLLDQPASESLERASPAGRWC